jgi:hypothetical protein
MVRMVRMVPAAFVAAWLAILVAAPGGPALGGGAESASGLALVLAEPPAVLQAGAAFELALTVRNVSDKTLRMPRWGLGTECGLAVSGPDGREIRGTFARDKTRELDEGDVCSLGPGESRRFMLGARFDAECGLTVDEPQGGVFTFAVTRGPLLLRARLALDPGTSFGRDFVHRFGPLWTGRAISPPREVAAAGVPAERGLSVGGLALALRADRSEFSMKPLNLRRALRDSPHYEVEPVALAFTFRNVSEEPLRLDAFDIVWSLLALEVEGPSEHAVVRKEIVAERLLAAPVPGDFPVLAPGGSFRLASDLRFPGEVGGERIFPNAPGTYRLRILYRAGGREVPAGADPSAGPRTWAGEIASNPVELTGREVAAPASEDRPK